MTPINGEIQVKNLDHLGLVAGIVDELGIVEIINELWLFRFDYAKKKRDRLFCEKCGNGLKAIAFKQFASLSGRL